MEAEKLQITRRVHHGHNIRRTRIEKNIKQDALSDLVHLSQSAISKYEKAQVIDDEMLERFAKALNVPFEDLKTFEEEVPMIIFENNTNTNNVETNNGDGIAVGFAPSNENTINNPIDKITELYERMLKEKDEKIAMLENQIRELKL